MNIDCITCKRPLSRAAFISVLVMGDEYIHSFFLCEACNQYTVELYHDHFMGDDSVSTHRKSREEGDRLVKLIETCSTPEEKFCKCPAHKEFGG